MVNSVSGYLSSSIHFIVEVPDESLLLTLSMCEIVTAFVKKSHDNFFGQIAFTVEFHLSNFTDLANLVFPQDNKARDSLFFNEVHDNLHFPVACQHAHGIEFFILNFQLALPLRNSKKAGLQKFNNLTM